MPIIDAHVHLYPPEVNCDPVAWALAQNEGHWGLLCTRLRKDGKPVQLFPSVKELLDEMDHAGTERSILLGWYWNKPDTCVAQNRFYAECIRAHPDRLSAFATVHPAAGEEALAEVHRARDAGMVGLGELSPHSQNISMTDPALQAIISLAGDLKLPVNLHVTDPRSKPFPGQIATPEEGILRLAREFPATTFIFAHWGGGLAFDSKDRSLPNLYYDTAASPLMYDPGVWQRALEAVGPGRILFGSDIPLRLYPKSETGPGLAKFVSEARAALAAKEIDQVLGGNAAKLLQWERDTPPS